MTSRSWTLFATGSGACLVILFSQGGEATPVIICRALVQVRSCSIVLYLACRWASEECYEKCLSQVSVGATIKVAPTNDTVLFLA